MDKSLIAQRIERFGAGRVMVVGDVAIDEMIYGETGRISREAPVLILMHRQTDILLGAGSNAAHNLAALGAERVTMVGLAGKDYYCSLLFEAMERDGVSTEGMVQDESRPTITKTRITGSSRQSVAQQVVRIDRESHEPISQKTENALIEKILTLGPDHDAIIISDYKLGVVTESVIEACQSVARAKDMVLAVDSHRDLRLFNGASIATPNLPEAEDNMGYGFPDISTLVRAGQELKHRAHLQNLLITRGSEGMTLFTDADEVHHIPAFNRSEVFDVTGAGDTVIATLTLAMATGSTTLQAALLGNLAASLVVKRYGTATTTQTEMLNALSEMETDTLAFDTVRV